MFQLVAVFLIYLVESEIFLLMRQNTESYRGDFQFPHTLASRLLWGVGAPTTPVCRWYSDNSGRNFSLYLLSPLLH